MDNRQQGNSDTGHDGHGNNATTPRPRIKTMLELYTALSMQGLSVSTFDSDKKTITFKSMTTAEMLVISATLKALMHDNEIIVQSAGWFKIRFL